MFFELSFISMLYVTTKVADKDDILFNLPQVSTKQNLKNKHLEGGI